MLPLLLTSWCFFKVSNKDTVLGAPKTTLRLDELLEGLTGLRRAIILTVTVFYGKRIQIKISEGKGTWNEVQEKPGPTFQVSSPNGAQTVQLILPALRCDSLCQVLSTREAHLSLGFQGLIGSVIQACSICMADPSASEQKQAVTINHIVSINYLISWYCLTQGLRAHPPGASQGPVLKSDLS